MNRSTNYGFYLPENTDPISVDDFNYNFEQIDGKLNVANNLTTTAQGSVLDARQGKVLKDSVDAAVARQGSSSISTISDLISAVSSGTSYVHFVNLANTLTNQLVGVSRVAMAMCRDTGNYIDVVLWDSYAYLYSCTIKKSDGTVTDLMHYVTTLQSTASLEQGWSVSQSTNSVLKVGKTVTFSLWVTGGSITSNAWNTIATIPAGFRPHATFDVPAIDNQNDSMIHCQITAAGAVKVYGSANIHNSIRIYATYIVA